MIPTLIPDARAYATAMLGVAAPSSIALASHVHVRWLDHRGVRTIPVHAAVLAVVAAVGVTVLGGRVLAGEGGVLPGGVGLRTAAALPLGVVLGLVVTRLDTRVSRVIARRRATAAAPAAPPGTARGVRVRSAGLAASAENGPASVRTARRATATTPRPAWRPTRRDTDLRIGPGWLLSVAVLEELVFRGVLVRLALLPSSAVLRVAALVGGVLAFAFSHVFFGWGQALAKLPLAVLAVATVLLTGTVLAAVIGHAIFNWHVWRRMNAAAPAGGRTAT